MEQQFKNTIKQEQLTGEVSSSDVTKYLKTHKRTGTGWIALIAIFGFMWAIFFGIFLWTVIAAMIGGFSANDFDDATTPLIASLVLLVPTLLGVVLNHFGGRAGVVRQIRMQRFAEANGLRYQPGVDEGVSLEGLIFKVGNERAAYDTIRSRDGLPFTAGSYRYVTGTGRGRSSGNWLFAAVTLDESFSHTILDAKANNGKILSKELFSNLPQTFDKNQMVTVSSEVDQVYATFSENGAPNDAARLLAGDAIARINALSLSYDIELKGNQLFFYAETYKTVGDVMSELIELIDIATTNLKATPLRTGPPVAAQQTTGLQVAELRGGFPVYLKVLGVAAILIQIVALVLFIAL